jgi:hypothetical protein
MHIVYWSALFVPSDVPLRIGTFAHLVFFMHLCLPVWERAQCGFVLCARICDGHFIRNAKTYIARNPMRTQLQNRELKTWEFGRNDWLDREFGRNDWLDRL